MWRNAQPFGLSGGCRGALHYDIASLLYDGKADLPPNCASNCPIIISTCLVSSRNAVFMQHYYAYVYVHWRKWRLWFRGSLRAQNSFPAKRALRAENIAGCHNVQLPIQLPTLLVAFQSMLGSRN
jgi:hypothetical protein